MRNLYELDHISLTWFRIPLPPYRWKMNATATIIHSGILDVWRSFSVFLFSAPLLISRNRTNFIALLTNGSNSLHHTRYYYVYLNVSNETTHIKKKIYFSNRKPKLNWEKRCSEAHSQSSLARYLSWMLNRIFYFYGISIIDFAFPLRSGVFNTCVCVCVFVSPLILRAALKALSWILFFFFRWIHDRINAIKWDGIHNIHPIYGISLTKRKNINNNNN